METWIAKIICAALIFFLTFFFGYLPVTIQIKFYASFLTPGSSMFYAAST